jgi:serine/threonine protein kinase
MTGGVLALATCDSMVADLCRLQLLDDAQATQLATVLVPQFAEPRDLAREILRHGWVTTLQINQVLQNHGNALLVGPYLLLERLGEGGMAQVYKARHRSLGRIVALKIVRKEALTNRNAIPRFEREVQASAQLTHPNVVRAFDAGQAGGRYYLAMEFIEGVDLSQLVKQDGPLPVVQACDYIRQAALGLQHAHELGFVHRDIKPANLFLTRKTESTRAGSSALLPRPHGSALLTRPNLEQYLWGVVKILDFGLARLQVPDPRNQQIALTQQGTVMGTPDFLAPEQAWDSHDTDIRSDLYSLGCTFYYLLSGQVPFPGGTVPEKLIRQRNTEPEPIGKVRQQQLLSGHDGPPSAGLREAAQVPTKVAAVLKRLMAKEPADRFQTPAELAEALAELQPRRPMPANGVVVPPAKTRQPGTGNTPCPRRPADGSGVEATILVQRQGSGASPRTTKIIPLPAPRRRRLRNLLVYAGFLLCCALAGRLLASKPLRAEIEASPEPAAAIAPESGRLGQPVAAKQSSRKTPAK